MQKTELGKDMDMIEGFLQESLKSVYLTVIEYLNKVELDDPDGFKHVNHDHCHSDESSLGDENVTDVQKSFDLDLAGPMKLDNDQSSVADPSYELLSKHDVKHN